MRTDNVGKMNFDHISLEEVNSMVEETFGEKVAKYNDIAEFEVQCEKSTKAHGINAIIVIYGFAGSPTLDDFKNGKVTGAETFTIERPDIGRLTFTLDPSLTTNLNGTDFQISYISE